MGQSGQVGRDGKFDVLLRARDQCHGKPGGFQQGGVVRGGRMGGLPVQAGQDRIMEPLGSLGAEQVGQGVARHRLGNQAVFATLQGVGDGQSGDGARAARKGFQHGCNRAGRDNGARRVLHQHDIGVVSGQGFQAGTHGILPLGAAGNDGQMGEGLRVPGR